MAGEEVCVHVEFKNPLSIKLKLSCVRIIYEFEPLAASSEETTALTTTALTNSAPTSSTVTTGYTSTPAAAAADLLSSLHVSTSQPPAAAANSHPVAFQGLGPLQPCSSTASEDDSVDEHHTNTASLLSAPLPGANGTAPLGQGRVTQHSVQVGFTRIRVA